MRVFAAALLSAFVVALVACSGMQDAGPRAMRATFPILSLSTVFAGTYQGQTQAVQSVVAWSFLIAHEDFPEADADWTTRTLPTSSDPRAHIHPSAGPTRAENAPNNSVLAFHPGALRHHRQRGIAGVM
ncbi:TAXI family TRAP transporter solute-binding subunit [Rubrivivax sp. RP6-9]|uniref:TAXI family TRAP transporter solute-binding subunit n=1 Tax=Rubrivivax sp. RP6-9 TaxID=3415750 RepID=UPI003CC604E1